MFVRFFARTLWTGVFVFSFLSGAAAGEIPLTPSLPSPPCLPTVQGFGMPKPPEAVADSAKVMPDLTAWENAPATPKKETILGNSSMSPVDPKWFANLAWPVRGKVSSGFGPRGKGARARMHQGIDIPVPAGTPVQASMAGTVIEARVYNGYGNTVIVDHGNGMQTLYAHCLELAVKEGETVKLGQVIAYAGSTGRSTTSHVHFGVMLSGTFRDPEALLKKPEADRLARK